VKALISFEVSKGVIGKSNRKSTSREYPSFIKDDLPTSIFRELAKPKKREKPEKTNC
jgi:hypothetical protein